MSDQPGSEPVVAIGTRGSHLARIQAGMVVDELRRAGHASRLVIVETDGDRRAPDTAWGEGAFVAAIERALLDGLIDVAVHSAKDLPTDVDPRLQIGAFLARADPRDALVVRAGSVERRLEDLAAGTRVGTDSPRRTAFLLASRPDLDVHPLHGNVDTRLRRLDSGETDALVLACAGLDRLGLADRITQRFEPELIPPAAGQGAIAVEVRTEDTRTIEIVAAIDHPATRLAVEAERSFLAASGGGCRSPIGAYATISLDELDLMAGVARPDGSGAVTSHRRGPVDSGPQMAVDLARTLGLAIGRLGERVIVTRSLDQSGELVAELRRLGLAPVAIPSIEVAIPPGGTELHEALAGIDGVDWVIVTSSNGARAVVAASAGVRSSPGGARWAVIGPATAAALEAGGIEPSFAPSEPSGEQLAAELPLRGGERVLVVRGDQAGSSLADALRGRGAIVDEAIAYRTIEAPDSSGGLVAAALAGGPIGAIVFTSGSTVRGLATLARAAGVDLGSIPAICVGPQTASAARAAGFRVAAVAPRPDAAAIAAEVAAALIPITLPVEANR